MKAGLGIKDDDRLTHKVTDVNSAIQDGVLDASKRADAGIFSVIEPAKALHLHAPTQAQNI